MRLTTPQFSGRELSTAITILSPGYRYLRSCSRAAGWSAATLCLGTEGDSLATAPGPVLKVDRKSWAPSRMTRLIRLESPKSIATVTNLAPVLPLMTRTNSELQSLLPQ